MIATEASNLLPLFYRSLSLSSLLYSRFVLPIRGCYTLACLLHFIPPPRFPQLHYASLRIGLRRLHSPRCRAPARISGKDFPLHSCTGCNQPPLMFFFSSFLSSLSALHAFRSHGHHTFFPSFFRLPLGLPHPTLSQYFLGIPQKPDRN